MELYGWGIWVAGKGDIMGAGTGDLMGVGKGDITGVGTGGSMASYDEKLLIALPSSAGGEETQPGDMAAQAKRNDVLWRVYKR